LSNPVYILDNDSKDVLFGLLSPSHVVVNQNRRLTSFAVEDGSNRSDHVVEEPIQITIDFLVQDDLINQIQSIRSAWEDNKLFTVMTRADMYKDMFLIGMPHDEPSNMIGIGLTLVFQEYKTVYPEYDEAPIRVEQPKQTDTKKRGKVFVGKKFDTDITNEGKKTLQEAGNQ